MFTMSSRKHRCRLNIPARTSRPLDFRVQPYWYRTSSHSLLRIPFHPLLNWLPLTTCHTDVIVSAQSLHDALTRYRAIILRETYQHALCQYFVDSVTLLMNQLCGYHRRSQIKYALNTGYKKVDKRLKHVHSCFKQNSPMSMRGAIPSTKPALAKN